MRVLAALVSLMLAGSAAAEPFWVEYNASCGLFPEEVGWERTVYGGGAERWIQDGYLVLDGLVGSGISDFYRMDAPVALEPGERFVMEWRLRVDEVPGLWDPGINFTVLGEAMLTLVYTESTIYSLYETMTIASFEPGVFHDYSLTSTDLETYTLCIGGEPVHGGLLSFPGGESRVRWGDYGRPASLSTWSSVAFGVVPEPFTGAITAAAALLVLRSRISRKGRTYDESV